MSKISRRKFLALAAGTALVPYGYHETNALEISHRTITLDRLPTSFSGLTICHLTDLHSKQYGPGQERLLGLVRDGRPDIIVMTGDMVDAPSDDEQAFMALCDHLPDIAPTYFVTGNHELVDRHKGIAERVSKRRVQVMENRHTLVERGNAHIYLAGIGDWSRHGFFGLDKALRGIPDDEFTLLLSHRPERMANFVSKDVDLVLSGHTHGGQIKFPFIGGIIVPDQQLFPRYMEGIYCEKKTTLFISRGLGESLLPIRLNCPSELVFLTLRTDRRVRV